MYLLPVKTALIVFPLLAFLLFIPAAILTYRRHGVMAGWRTLSFYSFLFYSLTAFLMTVIPAPDRSTVDVCVKYAEMSHPQLVPGNTFSDIWKEADHRIGLGSLIVQNPATLMTLFNFALLLPLGMYLHYHFRRGFWVTSLIGFAASLFFEFTQYTGIWGIYECPYRLFDVDDLIVNTAGCMLGWRLARPLTRILPTLDSLDDAALARRPVPLGRRALALLVDVLLLPIFVLGATAAWYLLLDGSYILLGPILGYLAYFAGLPWLFGATPGKKLLLLALAGPDGRKPRLAPLLARAFVTGVLLSPFLVSPVLGLAAVERFGFGVGSAYDLMYRLVGLGESAPQLALLGLAITGGYTVLLLAFLITLWRHPRHHGLHERISGVHNVALPHKRAVAPEPVLVGR
ncbi:VanZ family protein [Pseudonocardiaceae bacterium YIM PH 21723]|nr:VanZ family protein [Pseudonocardiaceae bacterium YIM PH 21723]